VKLSDRIDWGWRPAAEPAAPRAVVAWGEAAPRLHARLGTLAADRQARLQATASRDVLIVSGETLDLPWVAGAAYAAPCALAPALWLPTLWQPDVPSDLLARAVTARHGRQPLLMWREPSALVPLDRQVTVSPALLTRIAGLWQGTVSA
jgi:hypothetical protein